MVTHCLWGSVGWPVLIGLVLIGLVVVMLIGGGRAGGGDACAMHIDAVGQGQ